MADLDHRTLSSANVHEPKHITSSTTSDTGKVITASSSTSGSSEFRLLTPDDLNTAGGITNIASEMSRERALEATSLAASQLPSATGTPLQVEFGAAQGTGSDPVQIDSSGNITVNEGGLYLVKTYLQVGRSSGAGTAILFARVKVNGTQVGRSFVVKSDSADVTIPISDDSLVIFPDGAIVTYEIMRDSAGNNDGGLYASSSSHGWNAAPSAYIRFERFI